MERSTVAYDRRYVKALELVVSGAVSPNGADGQYYVRSQAGAGTYNVQSRRATDGQPVCTCPDDAGRLWAGACEHILATEIYEGAERHAQDLRQRHSMTWSQLEDHILGDLCHPHDNMTNLKLDILLATVRRLGAAEQESHTTPSEIALVVRYRTSGGRTLPHAWDGELLEVIEDGQSRQPKVKDLDQVYAWLQAHGYQVAEMTWIDGAGYLRRRRQVYRKSA